MRGHRRTIVAMRPASNHQKKEDLDQCNQSPFALANLRPVDDAQLSFHPNISFRGPQELWLEAAR